MAIQDIPYGSELWTDPLNNDLHELDARTTANGGGIKPVTVSDGLVWIGGATADKTEVKYYQLADCKRVVVQARWVTAPAASNGTTNYWGNKNSNHGRIIGKMAASLAPASNICIPMNESLYANFQENGDLVLSYNPNITVGWDIDKGELGSGTFAINVTYEA